MVDFACPERSAEPCTLDPAPIPLRMRIDYGPGYRVYFVRRGGMVVVLLCGGDKRNQDRDIARAVELAQEV